MWERQCAGSYPAATAATYGDTAREGGDPNGDKYTARGINSAADGHENAEAANSDSGDAVGDSTGQDGNAEAATDAGTDASRVLHSGTGLHPARSDQHAREHHPGACGHADAGADHTASRSGEYANRWRWLRFVLLTSEK